MNGWLGEAQGLRTSLEAAKSKLASLKGVPADRLFRNRSRDPDYPWVLMTQRKMMCARIQARGWLS